MKAAPGSSAAGTRPKVRRGHSPVIAGVGQVANKDADSIVHPVDLIAAAAALALADAGIPSGDIGGVLATPLSTFSAQDPSQLVAERLGLAPGLRSVAGYSGAGPQRLIAQACRAILDGTVRTVLVVGGIADASVRRARQQGLEPPAPPTSRWSQGTSATAQQNDTRELRQAYHPHIPEIAAGAGMPSAYFALVESAMSAGTSPDAQREALGRLLAPFTQVAARRPDLAWFPTARSAAEIGDPTAANRWVAEPYTKLMCSFPTVDLAAALVITADTAAAAPAVRPLAVVSGREAVPPSGRPVFHRSEALCRVVEQAQRLSGIAVADVAQFDLYSCFPAAVQLAMSALALPANDTRPLTATGGLPYFGGPGASYSLHAIACLVEDLRNRPGTVGAAVSLGGMLTDFALGFYGVVDAAPCQVLDLGKNTPDPVATAHIAAGVAIVEASTVLHDRDGGPVAAPLVARLGDGTRTGARAGDPALPSALAGGRSLVGSEVVLSATEAGHISYLPR